MECPNISHLNLDEDDREAIGYIRNQQQSGNMLEIIMPMGVLTTIFLGNNSAQAAYNIHSTDFVLFAKAVSTVNAVFRKTIQTTAAMQTFKPGKSHEQRQFWRAVAEGCTGGPVQ